MIIFGEYKKMAKIHVLQKNSEFYSIRLYDEDDTMGNLLIHRIGRSKMIDHVSYRRCHYLETPSFIDLQYKTVAPTDQIEHYFIEAIDHLLSETDQIFSPIS